MIKREDDKNEVSGVVKMLQSLQPDMLAGLEEAEITFKDGVFNVKAGKRHTVANVIECIESMTEKLEKANSMLEWAHKEVLRLNIENSELRADLSMAERERDAAVRDLDEASSCRTCAYGDIYENCTVEGKCARCDYIGCPCESCRYKWRGVCEDNTKEGAE